ncbi:hypothetical protein PAMP_023133 [Pampus punctatissimus]
MPAAAERDAIKMWSTVSDPVRPGDSVTLQCSVVSESQNEMCPGETSIYWYRAGSHASHPAFIYTDGNSRDICREKPGIHSSPKSCVYRFSKNISSSDAGTYYCAVATCGDILFGNGTKVELGIENTIAETRRDNLRQPVHDTTEAEDKMNYAALNFSERKATRGRKKKEFSEDSVYSEVKH